MQFPLNVDHRLEPRDDRPGLVELGDELAEEGLRGGSGGDDARDEGLGGLFSSVGFNAITTTKLPSSS